MSKRTEEIKARCAAELARAEKEDRIEESLAGFEPDRIFVSPLYGRVATVTFGDSYRHDKKATLTLARALAEQFPGVPMVLLRDGCTSFRPLAYQDSLPEDKRRGDESPICPVKAEFEIGRTWLEWVSDVPGVGLLEFNIHLAPYAKWASYSAKQQHWRGMTRYKEHGSLRHQVYDVRNAAGVQVAQPGQVINWERGSEQYAGRATLYWEDIDADHTTTAADIVNAIMLANGEAAKGGVE